MDLNSFDHKESIIMSAKGTTPASGLEGLFDGGGTIQRGEDRNARPRTLITDAAAQRRQAAASPEHPPLPTR